MTRAPNFWLVATGDLTTGLTFIGPFPTLGHAADYTQRVDDPANCYPGFQPEGPDDENNEPNNEDNERYRDWQHEVANQYTMLGFNEWLASRTESGV